MIDESPLPHPTVTSNSQAARRACHHERERVVRILAAAEVSIPQPVLDAIAEGTPAAIFASKQSRSAAAANDGSNRPGAARTKSRWSKITSRVNAKRRSTAEPADPEAAAT